MADIAELIIDEVIVVTSCTGSPDVFMDGDSSLVAELGSTANGEAFIPDGKPTVVYINEGSEEALSAKVLIVEKIAEHDFSALRMMVLPTSATCKYGQPTSYEDAKVSGLSINAGLAGSTCKILLFGQHIDAFFSFANQVPLFLGVDGVVTDVVPSSPTSSHQVTIGQSLGSGSIMVNISEPIAI